MLQTDVQTNSHTVLWCGLFSCPMVLPREENQNVQIQIGLSVKAKGDPPFVYEGFNPASTDVSLRAPIDFCGVGSDPKMTDYSAEVTAANDWWVFSVSYHSGPFLSCHCC